MDRVCPSYGAGYDACDPFAAVLNGQSESRAARVLRRRCRSEGIERSPYEDTLSRSEIPNYFRPLPKTNSSMTTSDDDCRKDLYMSCLRSTPTNGEYLRLDNKKYGYLPVHQKSSAMSPLKPLLITKDDSRLPKVEEFLEKDHEYVTIAKQPLKSILNNPLPISQPQGILKKPKNRSSLDSKLSEGRRRQRASSESDNFFCNYGTSPAAYDCRVYSSNAMKRAKDNSGTGYSYGTAVASLSPHKCFKSCSRPSSHYSRSQDICDRSRLNCQRSQDVCDSQSRSSCLRSQDVCDSQSRSSCLRSQDVCDSQSRSSCLRSQEVCDSQSRSNCSRSQDVCDIQSRSSCLRSQDVCDSQSRSSCMSSQDFCDSRSRSNYLNIPENGRRDQCDIQVLRTTAINEVVLDFDNTPMSGCNSPVPTCPVVSPALPVSSETPGHPIKTTGCITMKNITKLPEHEDHSRSPSMDRECDSDMETDPIQEEEITNSYPLLTKHNEQNSMSNLSLKLTNGAVVSKKNHSKDITPEVPENMKQALRQSLFPRVPPYIKFVGHDDKNAPKLPISIQKHLIWKLTTITPIVVKNTLINSGFRLVKSDCDTSECPQEETIEWVGIWGKHMKSLMFRAIKDGQKMNHFPGTFQIGRKDRLWRNLQKLVSKYGSKEFGIMPKTYILPNDMKLLKHDWEKHTANNEKWIIKPPASARGTGIKVISRWTQIPKKRPVVVQKYVSKPYLINGSKFDIRLYVLVTSVHPLRIYLHNDGLARFASVKYNDEPGSLNDRYMHLTNYSINRLSKNYTPNEDFAACEGHKWTLQTLFHYLKTEKAVDTQGLWESLKDLVIKTVISGESGVTSLTRDNVTSRYTCYELFGVDVLLEQDLKPWLLEVNISPSLHSASPLDIHVKAPLVSAVLNLAQFQLPVMQPNVPSYDNRLYTVYLSKEERDKHTIYTKMDDRDLYVRDILSTLTPDDVRHLIQAEDELTQVGCMERIFPTQKTHRYLGFLNGARYYNRLFDAWETHYGLNRDEGIERLRKLCDIGYHQCVPPPPLKNNVEETQASRTT